MKRLKGWIITGILIVGVSYLAFAIYLHVLVTITVAKWAGLLP